MLLFFALYSCAAGFSYSSSKEPFYQIPAIIAINMIIACAAGGTLSIGIAMWAQVKVGQGGIGQVYCIGQGGPRKGLRLYVFVCLCVCLFACMYTVCESLHKAMDV